MCPPADLQWNCAHYVCIQVARIPQLKNRDFFPPSRCPVQTLPPKGSLTNLLTTHAKPALPQVANIYQNTDD